MNAFNPTAPLLPPSHAHGDELHFSLYCILKLKICVKLFFSLFKKRLNRSFFHKKSRDIVPFHNLLASNPLSSDQLSTKRHSSKSLSSNRLSSCPLSSNPLSYFQLSSNSHSSKSLSSSSLSSNRLSSNALSSSPLVCNHSQPIHSHPTHILYSTFNPFSSKSLLANLLTHTLKTNFHPISQ